MQEETKQETVEEVVVENAEENPTPVEEVDPRDEKIEELQTRLLRLQADFDNYRKRVQNEQMQLSSYVTAEVVGKFIKVLDNFERAEASINEAAAPLVAEGIGKIRRQFDQTLTELKVEEIQAMGEEFNPNYHEAVMRGANPDFADDSIDLVLEKGYKIGERIVRHSKVRVVNN